MAAVLRLALGGLLAALASLGAHAQAGSASLTTDRAQYRPGETITICYSVPGPGPVTVTDYSSDGRSPEGGCMCMPLTTTAGKAGR
jgi:hypothetical protein